ncbi:MAG TPA: efflux RND transporter periplasmic adaptor subunit [Terriglobia bacterium]|nr:efflux RND transporter periplasmic adaptor subunit [Terriglobia bacterium]
MNKNKGRILREVETAGTAWGFECRGRRPRGRLRIRKAQPRKALWCISLALCLGGTACSNKAEQEPSPTVAVQVAAVEKTSIQNKVSADAVLYPLSQASLVPKISAPVIKYYVNRGSHVHAGELMAELENKDLAAASTENQGGYQQAQAAYEEATKAAVPEEVQKAELDMKAAKESFDAAQKVYDSRQSLFKEGAIARKELDDAGVALVQARNQYEIAKRHWQSVQSVTRRSDLKSAAGQLSAAKGKYQGAQAQLSYSEIRSPIQGVVTDRPLNLGEMATAGTPVITVMDTSQVIARAHVAQQEATLMRVGDAATISMAGISDEFPGKVSIVSPALDPNSTTVEVWVQASNRGEHLKPGASVRVSIVTETVKDALVIPSTALLTAADGGTSVIVANGNTPVIKPVKVGIKNGDDVQITTGLSEGEKVVTVGAYELFREDPDVLAKTKLEIQTPKKEEDDKGGAEEPSPKGGEKD